MSKNIFGGRVRNPGKGTIYKVTGIAGTRFQALWSLKTASFFGGFAMNVTSVTDAAAYQPQGAAARAQDNAEFDEILEASARDAHLRVFAGAPDFIVEWAQKYNVHISLTAVPKGKNGPYTPALEGQPPIPTVHIHPKALERMTDDPAFARKIEQEIARCSSAMHHAQGFYGDKAAGTSITIDQDGNAACAIFWEDEDTKGDDWEMVSALMKKVDVICEQMHADNLEKVKRQLEEIQKNRAAAEFRRLSVTPPPEVSDTSGASEPEE
jgi:hypothetical protein